MSLSSCYLHVSISLDLLRNITYRCRGEQDRKFIPPFALLGHQHLILTAQYLIIMKTRHTEFIAPRLSTRTRIPRPFFPPRPHPTGEQKQHYTGSSCGSRGICPALTPAVLSQSQSLPRHFILPPNHRWSQRVGIYASVTTTRTTDLHSNLNFDSFVANMIAFFVFPRRIRRSTSSRKPSSRRTKDKEEEGGGFCTRSIYLCPQTFSFYRALELLVPLKASSI
jgi:hypothetical protein